MMSWWNRSKAFLAETRSEMRKVSFPSRDDVVQTTIVVLVTSVIFAAYLWLTDLAIGFGYEGILRVFS